MPLISYTVAAVFFSKLPLDTTWYSLVCTLRNKFARICGHQMGVVQNYGTRQRPYAALSRTFRAPAESGHEIMIRFSFTYKFINIMVFRPFANLTPPFRGLSPLQQDIHIHICRCHSDTKSLAWVLGQLPNEYGNANLWTQVYCKMNAKMIEG